MTTSNINASVSEDVYAIGTSWPQTVGTGAGSNNDVVAARGYTGGQYYVYNRVIQFDTSAIPDGDEIISADITFRALVLTGSSAYAISGEWYNQPGTITAADYSNVVSDTAFAAIAVSTLTPGVDYTKPLLNPDANINKAGVTAIRTHYSDLGAPAGNNYYEWASPGAAGAPYMTVVHQPAAGGPIQSSMFLAM